jgi:LysR family glycine cleavage system transcriptional activator
MKGTLPPLNALRAFEAAARHGSLTRAAQELSVTQGAVSRHVSQLEKWLGVGLFIRTRRGTELTAEGSAYYRGVQRAFEEIDSHTRSLMRRPASNTLRLKLPPTFAIRWLVPRLARFHAQNRHIDVQITTSHQSVDFNREDVDVAIHSGPAPDASLYSRKLLGETLLPVCSPGLLKHHPKLSRPQDLSKHVLLCSMHRPNDWPNWLKAAGVIGVDGNGGLRFENSALAYQAATDELGVVMAQHAFVEDDLRVGRLIAPFDLRVETDEGYYIACPDSRRATAKVAAFEKWITGAV